MLQRTEETWQRQNWQSAWSQAIRTPAELLKLLELPLDLLPGALAAGELFPLRVPRGYAARMVIGDPHDPLLRQVLPLQAETIPTPDFAADPVGDLKAMPVPGLLHKYQGRVLLVTTGACAIHCRYCFRRHFPYAEANPGTEQWQAALDYIAADASISEVILSGGDPLALTDTRLAALARQLASIPHVQRLRLHSRLPIVLPERITPELLAWMSGTRLQPVMVVHANHAQEIDASVEHALAALKSAGITLLNQAVLLKDINDSVEAQQALCERLFACGVIPYYLHVLDRVAGAAHFEVPEPEAQALMATLRARLPGYLLPKLVRETPGAPSKLAL